MSGDILGSGASYEFKITTSLNEWGSQKRFNASIPLSELKARLELISGFDHRTMQLKLYSEKDEFLCELVDVANTLEQAAAPVHLRDGLRLHVDDKSGKSVVDLKVDDVPKFELSPEEYEQRQESALQFKMRLGLGRFKPVDQEEEKRREAEKDQAEEVEKKRAATMKVGNRCEVTVAKQPKRRGEVMFVGEVHFKPGVWVGVKYDEPVGKNDGSVEGKRYFTCPAKYGGMVRPSQVEVGNFPEIGCDDLDEL